MDKLKEECGLFGIYGDAEASHLTYLGLYALQHRGQESAGIVTYNGIRMQCYKQMGLVADVFKKPILTDLNGHIAMGHVRYSTTGSSLLANAQPLFCEYKRGSVAVAHNGNLINAGELKKLLEEEGSIFQSTSDSEILVHYLARSPATSFDEALMAGLSHLQGAYSLLIMTEKALYAIRDPYGFRPLSIGRRGNAIVFCSETCALDIIDAEYIRDVKPGEIVKVDRNGIHSLWLPKVDRLAKCIFEFIYFSRPDSMVFGESVYKIRKAIGVTLARECPTKADVVISVPDSSNCAAAGYSHGSGIPSEFGIIRNHYIGRTFIEPSQSIRDFGAKIKYNPVRDVIAGKRVVVVDDSIVRGTTVRKIVNMLRKAGAKEIHMRIASPRITHSCYYGIDTPHRNNLIAANMNLAETQAHIGADSLYYISIPGLLKAAGGTEKDYCIACFNGDYPGGCNQATNKEVLEKRNRQERLFATVR